MNGMRVLFLKLFYPLLSLSSFINPFYGVLNYAFITVIRPESMTWGGSIVKNVSYMAIVCLVLASLFKRVIRGATLKKGFFIAFGLFYLSLYYATIQSPITSISTEHHQYTMNFVRQILIIFVYCLCMYNIVSRDFNRVLVFINALMLMFLFMGLWGIEQRLQGNMLVEGLFGSAIKDRCAITGIFILIFPLGLYNFNYPYKGMPIWKYCGLGSSLVSVLMVFFTDSRAGFLGFVFSIGILCVSMKKKVRNIILLCIFVGLLFPMLPDNYQKRIQSIGKASGGTETVDRSAGSRLVMWKSAILIFLEHPFFGVGNLNFAEEAYNRRYYLSGKISNELYDYTFQEHFKLQCHNMFLNIFAEGGLVTSIPFYLLMAIPVIKAVRLRNVGKDKDNPELFKMNRLLFYMLSGMMGYLVTCFFANMRFIDYFYWMLTLLLIVGEMLVQKVDRTSNDIAKNPAT